ncbi:MAG: glycerophosphodiester phosphodiesterase family protein [Pseudomonadota bacterium]
MRAWCLAAVLGLAACGGSDGGGAPTETAPGAKLTLPALPDFFDCVREQGGLVIAAHRGGPAPGYPENAIETMQHALEAGIYVMEVDVAESRDGVLFLMHDRSLTRTTTISGAVADRDWADIRAARLVDNDGAETAFSPPLLTDALIWAKETGAVLELDRKPTTSFRNIIAAVRAAEAEAHAILISYNDDQAAEIARLAPDLMLTAGARGSRDIGPLEARGVDPDKLIGWTGTERPDAAAWRRLADEQVEPAFGTLGRRGERLDDVYLADGDPSEYQNLVDDGLVLLATDEPYRVAEALDADDLALQRCAS